MRRSRGGELPRTWRPSPTRSCTPLVRTCGIAFQLKRPRRHLATGDVEAAAVPRQATQTLIVSLSVIFRSYRDGRPNDQTRKVQMTPTHDSSIADMVLASAREAAAHALGDTDIVRCSKVTRRQLNSSQMSIRAPEPFTAQRIRTIRDRLNISQAVFADLLNISASTVRAWEQGQRTPDGPSLRLLEIAEQEPAALLRMAALHRST